jgi:hypothetical protein
MLKQIDHVLQTGESKKNRLRRDAGDSQKKEQIKDRSVRYDPNEEVCRPRPCLNVILRRPSQTGLLRAGNV